jgi:hypothetical protein
MSKNRINLIYSCKLILSSIIIGVSNGCYAAHPVAVEPERDVFMFSVRQLPLPPVYNQLKNVRPPGPIPVLASDSISSIHFEPQFTLHTKNISYEEITKRVARLVGFSSYCSSFIARKKTSMHASGSIDDIASEISKVTGAKMVVDHDNREIRFLMREGE